MASRPAAPPRWQGRVPALVAVGLVHLAIGYALIVGLGVVVPPRLADTATRLIVIEQPPPPPAERQPRPKPKPSAHKPGGAPAPKAPPPPQPPTVPTVALPAPTPIVPLPAPIAGGTPASGAGGVGMGSGGTGTGTGSGSGSGAGGGGVFTEAEQIKGRFKNSDYPKSAKGAGRLRTGVRYAVGPDGLVRDCTVTEPSGWPEVDAMTCRVITERYRFRPARNPRGEPVTQVIEEGYTWTMD